MHLRPQAGRPAQPPGWPEGIALGWVAKSFVRIGRNQLSHLGDHTRDAYDVDAHVAGRPAVRYIPAMSAPLPPPPTPTAAKSAELSPAAARLRDALGLELSSGPVRGDEASAAPSGAVIRYHHHQIARLLAQGRKPADIAIATGYSAGYISNLKNHDPAFRQLIAHYEATLDAVMASAGEQLRALGEEAIAILKDRLISNPDDFPRSQLMELIELAFGKSGGAKAGGIEVGRNTPAPVAVQVTFVGPDRGTDNIPHALRDDSQVIDVIPRIVEPTP